MTAIALPRPISIPGYVGVLAGALALFSVLITAQSPTGAQADPDAPAFCDSADVSAGSNAATVQTAVSAAADGATLCFASGSYTWSSNIDFETTKGLTLACIDGGTCSVTMSATLGMNGTCSDSSKLYRISGFDFTSSGTMMWWYSSTACEIDNFRFDNNTITGASADTTYMYFGEGSSADNYIWGVIDNNTITCSSSCYLAQFYNDTNTPAANEIGTVKAMFIEDNTMTVTTMTNSGTGCVDGWGGHSVVVRYNTVTNCRILMHGVTHGWGPILFAVYGNNITQNANSGLDDCYRSIHHQGSGIFIAWGNTFTCNSTISSSAIEVLHYRDWTTANGYAICDGTVGIDGNRTPIGTYYGYPCYRQPARDIDADLFPIYSFLNRNSGSQVSLSCDDQGSSAPNTCTDHIVADRDRFEEDASFDGTSGVGVGVASSMPSTCTANSESADAGMGGVGYWATDEGTWNSDNAGADGRLYHCSATNTWTLLYTPLAKPHPLRTS